MKPLTNAQIDAHELLSKQQRALLKQFRNLSKKQRETFTMLDFARISLRVAGKAYADADGGLETAVADHDLQHAAILYVYELLKAVDEPLIKEWDGFDEMLRSIEVLNNRAPTLVGTEGVDDGEE